MANRSLLNRILRGLKGARQAVAENKAKRKARGPDTYGLQPRPTPKSAAPVVATPAAAAVPKPASAPAPSAKARLGTPEEYASWRAWSDQLGQSLVENLNRNVLAKQPPPVMPAPSGARYIVEVYDNFSSPDERCCSRVGEFDTAEKAIAHAQGIVDVSLDRMRQPGQSAAMWYRQYSTSGDGIYILSEPSTGFNPYHYAKARIERLTGERVKEWGEN